MRISTVDISAIHRASTAFAVGCKRLRGRHREHVRYGDALVLKCVKCVTKCKVWAGQCVGLTITVTLSWHIYQL